MFEGFSRFWVIVGLAREVRADRLTPLVIAGERLVLFRDAGGQVAALVDRCPHRGVALSLGRVRNGIVECPFHGWQFDGTGRNCRVPWNPDARRDRLGAQALVAREDRGLVWLYTGLDPADAPMPLEALLRDDVTLCAQSWVWDAHWTRVMENMLDTPHLPFVHRATIGRRLAPYVDRAMQLRWQPTAYGADITREIDGEPADGSRLAYRFPNVMELVIDPPGRLFRLLAVCTPEREGRTRLTLITVRNFAKTRWLDPVFRRMNARIAREDRRIVESSMPREIPHASWEASVRTDRPTLAFRKIYFERIRDGRSDGPPREHEHAHDADPTNSQENRP